MNEIESTNTATKDYAHRLSRLSGLRWKKLLNVQLPYAVHTRRVCTGSVLDIGCGIGRNLGHLRGRGTGVDHNAEAVRLARLRGYEAYTDAEFFEETHLQDRRWDTVLMSHILEHLSRNEIDTLFETYAPFLVPGGRLVIICPQEWAYARDITHTTFLDTSALLSIAESHDFAALSAYSFPWPRWAGRWMPYGEFVVVAERASESPVELD